MKNLKSVIKINFPAFVILTYLLFFFLTSFLSAKSYFISPNGLDSNDGTISSPFKTITFALTKVTAGDSIILRQGTYSISTTISISKSGTEQQKLFLVGYEKEKALLDFSSMPFSSSNRGINLKGSYWYLKGLDFKGAGDNGMNLSGSNNIIEFCSFYENQDTGLQLSGGASNNQIINCDSYFNADPSNGNADGFSPKLDVGTNNYFYGCRAWQNSDDGWDGYMRGSNDVSTTLENCWCFNNGYLKNGNPSSGNGNGFKTGGSDDKTLMHNMTLIRCISFDNRVKGFDQNNNRGNVILTNCSAYRNGTNYAFPLAPNTGKSVSITNCALLGFSVDLGTFVIQKTNSWQIPAQISESDFTSSDTTGVRGKRNEDGSLPDVKFLHLSKYSKLVDAGTDIGLTYFGKAPDLGAFESEYSTAIKLTNLPQDFELSQNYPNPFNPYTSIRYKIKVAANVQLKIYDNLGNEVETLVNGFEQVGDHIVQFPKENSQLASGVYFYKLTVKTADKINTEVRKMALIK